MKTTRVSLSELGSVPHTCCFSLTALSLFVARGNAGYFAKELVQPQVAIWKGACNSHSATSGRLGSTAHTKQETDLRSSEKPRDLQIDIQGTVIVCDTRIKIKLSALLNSLHKFYFQDQLCKEKDQKIPLKKSSEVFSIFRSPQIMQALQLQTLQIHKDQLGFALLFSSKDLKAINRQ